MTTRSLTTTWLLCVALVAGAAPSMSGQPRTILLRGEWLQAAKSRLTRGDAALGPAFDALIAAADAALSTPPRSVVQKQKTPPSGNKHDYMSLAPYWWPDSTKPDGLPYVRHDGRVNPASRVDHDGTRLSQTINAAEALTLAHFFTGRRDYADRAARLLRVFFIDTATRMNPNARYAQAVLGVNDGRGTGIIDTRLMPQLVDAVRLLEATDAWSAHDRAGMTEWCRAYLTWLLTSTNGRDERAAKNNHGTWYDAQAAALALFVDDSATARQILAVDAPRRLASQFLADGTQPAELARTRPIGYSVYNLDAFTTVAELARHVAFDLWHYAAPNGANLQSALRAVAPYADAAAVWPTPETTPTNRASLLPLFRRALAIGRDSTLTAALAKLPPDMVAAHRTTLLYP